MKRDSERDVAEYASGTGGKERREVSGGKIVIVATCSDTDADADTQLSKRPNKYMR